MKLAAITVMRLHKTNETLNSTQVQGTSRKLIKKVRSCSLLNNYENIYIYKKRFSLLNVKRLRTFNKFIISRNSGIATYLDPWCKKILPSYYFLFLWGYIYIT